MRRTATASALTLAAVALPCGAWYVAGTRAAEREGRAILEGQARDARDAALRMAERLGTRLEDLRRSESERPFYHFQSLYHDPRGASEGISVLPSPLASGPTDPLVRAHFQIDSQGHLSIPSLNEEVCDLNLAENLALQTPILQELQAAARLWWRGMRERIPGPPQDPLRTKIAAASPGNSPRRLELLEAHAWAQNLQASRLYQDLKSHGHAESPAAAGGGTVVIEVGELAWRTVDIDGTPTLVALRELSTPTGPFTQGFQIAADGVAAHLRDSPWPARFLPGEPASPTEAQVDLGGERWRVAVSLGDAVKAAEAQAWDVRRRFLRTFLVGSLLAMVAGASVVGLVAQTERLARERSQFAASAAHELRTPLAGMRVYAEMLAEGLGDPARARDYARRVADESDRLGRVVANVLGFTRIERRTLGVRCTLGDLGEALAPMLARLEPALEAAGARLVADVAPDLPHVAFDPEALLLVLQNLLDNAEKHTRGSPDRTIGVSAALEEGGIVLRVTDRGPGVPPAARRRLFRPFGRITRAEAPSGLGLGLAMVKALADAQGATVAYEDPPGGGACFSVRFPAATRAA